MSNSSKQFGRLVSLILGLIGLSPRSGQLVAWRNGDQAARDHGGALSAKTNANSPAVRANGKIAFTSDRDGNRENLCDEYSLNRPADDLGLAFWTNQITECGTNANCIKDKHINLSAATPAGTLCPHWSIWTVGRCDAAVIGLRAKEILKAVRGFECSFRLYERTP